jgi:Transglutaminase-like superfamily
LKLLHELRRARSFTAAEWRVLLSAALMLPAAALSIRVSGWNATRARAGWWTSRYGNLLSTHLDAHAVARLIRIAATHSVFSAVCLPQALVLWAFLKSCGRTPVVQLGARRGEHGIDAHAWVELSGESFDCSDPLVPYVPFRAQRS